MVPMSLSMCMYSKKILGPSVCPRNYKIYIIYMSPLYDAIPSVPVLYMRTRSQACLWLSLTQNPKSLQSETFHIERNITKSPCLQGCCLVSNSTSPYLQGQCLSTKCSSS